MQWVAPTITQLTRLLPKRQSSSLSQITCNRSSSSGETSTISLERSTVDVRCFLPACGGARLRLKGGSTSLSRLQDQSSQYLHFGRIEAWLFHMRPSVFAREWVSNNTSRRDMAADNALTRLLLTEVLTLFVSFVLILLYELSFRREAKPHSYWITRKLGSSSHVHRRGCN